MKSEKIAAVALVLIIVGAFTVFLTASNYPDILENIFPQQKTISEGSLADVHYIIYYASNDTIYNSSYEDPTNRQGGIPVKLFVTTNKSESPPEGYNGYSNTITNEYIPGLINGLMGLKEGDESVTIGPLDPENAYGVSPQIGTTFNLTEIVGTRYILKITDIQKDAPMPEDFIPFLGNGTVTLYEIREDWHYVGETVQEKYPAWSNSTTITKVNETLIWMYTTPPDDLDEYFDWITIDQNVGEQIIFPDDKNTIGSINDTEIIITHELDINDTISVIGLYGQQATFTVESINATTINTSYISDQETGEKQYLDFDKSTTILRNETRNITSTFPEIIFESQLIPAMKTIDPDFNISLHPLADETIYFVVDVQEVYLEN